MADLSCESFVLRRPCIPAVQITPISTRAPAMPPAMQFDVSGRWEMNSPSSHVPFYFGDRVDGGAIGSPFIPPRYAGHGHGVQPATRSPHPQYRPGAEDPTAWAMLLLPSGRFPSSGAPPRRTAKTRLCSENLRPKISPRHGPEKWTRTRSSKMEGTWVEPLWFYPLFGPKSGPGLAPIFGADITSLAC